MDEKQFEQTVEAITHKVMERLGKEGGGRKRILVLGKDPACPIRACLSREFDAEIGPDLARMEEFDFVVLPSWYAARLREQKTGADEASVVDFSGQTLLHERELRDRCAAGTRVVQVGEKTMITALAVDYLHQRGIEVRRGAKTESR